MDLYLLEMISLVLITAVIVLLVFNKLKLPGMIGLFLTGIILNYFIKSTEAINAISELGVIFLLFIIGLEFSIEKFSAIKHYAIIGGVLQVLITTVLVALISIAVGFPLNQAIFMGFLVCFSSTAIVMKIIQKKGLNHMLKGKVTLGILIFQDLAVIVVLLLTPVLGGVQLDFSQLPSLIIKLGLLIAIIAVGGIWVVPKVLEEAASTKNRDLFMILILFICLGTTYATSRLGIGTELGAFIAGLIISHTEYSHQTLGYIQPFQDVFMSLFLISIGLMIDVNFFLYNIVAILLLATGIILVKFIATFITGRILKLKLCDTVGIAILLSQIGEFSFILATEGMKYNLISSNLFTGFLTISIITMSSTPFLKNHMDQVTRFLEKIPWFRKRSEPERQFTNKKTAYPELESTLKNHVIIVGLGLTGKNIAYSCEHMNVPYICVDYDPIVVEREKLSGVPVIYGDGFSESILKELRVTAANCLIVTTSNPDHLTRIIDAAKRLNPNIHVIVRTRFVKNVDKLYEAGADEVIPEEFETSIMMFRLVMDYYNKDMGEINTVLQELRGERYNTLRRFSPPEHNAIEDEILESIYVQDERTLKDFNFENYDIKPVSIIRDDDMIQIDGNNFNVESDDLILFRGLERNIEKYIDDNHNVD